MRLALLLALVSAAVAQSVQMQDSHTTESFRGISAVSRNIAWASGTHGTYLRTTERRPHLDSLSSPRRLHSRLPRRRRLLRRRSLPHVCRTRRSVPHLPHHRRRAALATSIHQHQSQRIFRLHGFLGSETRHRPRRSHPRRIRQTEIRTLNNRRRPNLAPDSARSAPRSRRRRRRLRRQQHLHRDPSLVEE